MVARLGLRLRIFLFFGLIACGAVALAGGALWFAWSRAEQPLPPGPFLTAFVIFAFLNAALVAGIWLLFDENVARPIDKLAADLRLRAHSGVAKGVETEPARYLGDLAPAASAVSSALTAKAQDTAAEIARATEGLAAERKLLTALLTEIPVAMVLLNTSREIVLYDGQAAEVLSRFAPPRLRAPLTDYFAEAPLAAAHADLIATGDEVSFQLRDASGAHTLPARLRPVAQDGFLLIIEPAARVPLSPTEARPLVYDFDLLAARPACAIADTALGDLCFVVFDSETTGLSTRTDEVVQLSAVRVLNGRIVKGEVFDRYVNPGRPIPPGATKVHGITDRDVAGAPDFATAGRAFHAFARDAVLVAHNAPFDLAFLRRAERQMGVAWRHPILDTVLLSASCFGITEEHALDALCARLGIEIPPGTRHTALGDAMATAAALVKLIPLLKAHGIVTFGEAIAACDRHARLLKRAE